MKRRAVVECLTATLLLGVLVAGCTKQTIPIRTLLDDPGRYDHETVRISGTVESAIGVLGYGAYRVNDDTGVLTVVTNSGGAPREGAKVGVEGEFRAAFTLGTETVAALVESKRMEP